MRGDGGESWKEDNECVRENGCERDITETERQRVREKMSERDNERERGNETLSVRETTRSREWERHQRVTEQETL